MKADRTARGGGHSRNGRKRCRTDTKQCESMLKRTRREPEAEKSPRAEPTTKKSVLQAAVVETDPKGEREDGRKGKPTEEYLEPSARG